jgi:hypothetical protein
VVSADTAQLGTIYVDEPRTTAPFLGAAAELRRWQLLDAVVTPARHFSGTGTFPDVPLHIHPTVISLQEKKGFFSPANGRYPM